MEKELETKMNDIADGIAHVQEKIKADGEQNAVDFANIKEQADIAAKKLEDLQALELKKKAEDDAEKFLAIEKALCSTEKKDQGTKQEHKESFYSYLRKGNPMTPEAIEGFCEGTARKTLMSADPEKLEAYTKALIEGSNADGGFFVTPERSAAMVQRIFETSPVRGVANVVTTDSNSFEMILDDDEASCAWVGETTARAITDTPEIGLLTIPIHELSAKPQATQRMLDDAGFDIEGWLQGKVVDKFSRTENTAFVLGTGSNQPKGFMTYPAWDSAGTYQRDAIERITALGSTGVLDDAGDLINLQNALFEPYQMGAVFAGTRSTFADIMKLRETATAATYGAFVLDPTVMKDGSTHVVLGKPYVVMSDIAEVATSALCLAYGNFNQGYTIVDRFGVRVLRDPYSNKPYVQFYSTKRVGAAVSNFESIKILLNAAS